MSLAHHLLRHPSGVWHFRLIVPADLHALLGVLRELREKAGMTQMEFAEKLGRTQSCQFS